ncbi:MAG: hypothetical protein U0164_08265 [Gemmatimonadaceae bacterium]
MSSCPCDGSRSRSVSPRAITTLVESLNWIVSPTSVAESRCTAARFPTRFIVCSCALKTTFFPW